MVGIYQLKLIIMNPKFSKKVIMLFMSLALITVMGFSQNDNRKDQAKDAAATLTTSMSETLGLTDAQKELVEQYNLSYALSLFTTVPLTDEVVQEIDNALDSSLKEVLSEDQYQLWTDNKATWLDSVKKNLPKEDVEEVLEEATENWLK